MVNPNRRRAITVLSESVQGRNIRVMAGETNTLVHEVPDGEIHEITFYAANPSTSLNEVNGLWGGTNTADDVIDFTLFPESTRPELIRDAVLVGPASIQLRSKVTDVFVFGKVVVYVAHGN